MRRLGESLLSKRLSYIIQLYLIMALIGMAVFVVYLDVMGFSPISTGTTILAGFLLMGALAVFNRFSHFLSPPLRSPQLEQEGNGSAQPALEELNRRLDQLSKRLEHAVRDSTDVERLQQEYAELRNRVAHEHVARQALTARANLFEEEADLFAARAWIWLIGAAVWGVGIGILTWVAFRDVPIVGEKQLVPFISGRILLFSFLFSIFYLLISNYRINHHNYLVNRHRAQSLGLYIQIQSHIPENHRDVLLTEIVRSIIAPQPTGPGGHEDAKGPTINVVSTAQEGFGRR